MEKDNTLFIYAPLGIICPKWMISEGCLGFLNELYLSDTSSDK